MPTNQRPSYRPLHLAAHEDALRSARTALLLCCALLGTLIGAAPALAQNPTVPVRFVYTSNTTFNIVEDCWFCSAPDQIYYIGIAFRARFGDPASIFVDVRDTRDYPFNGPGQVQLNPFGDYVFSRKPDDPTMLVPDVEFVADEEQPMLFGIIVMVMERNPSLSPNAILDATREAADDTFVQLLREEVGFATLTSETLTDIPGIAFNIAERAAEAIRLDVDDVIEEQVFSGLNPDHKIGASSIIGTAFQNPETARRVEDEARSDSFVALDIDAIGHRLFQRLRRLNYKAQRLVEINAKYDFELSGMALE